MATKEEKKEPTEQAKLNSLMAKHRDSIQDYLDSLDMEEADEKKAKKEKEKK